MANCTSFATDILPMFTQTDIQHMKPMGVYLSDYAWMKVPANAQRVYGQVSSGNMPPGNPWSQDKVACFKSWMSNGYQP